MKRLMALLMLTTLCGCGNSAVDNELVGQAKKFAQQTPLICMDYQRLDISLGIMRGGTGSMSTQDVWMTVTNPSHIEIIKKAVETTAIIRVRYNDRRFAPCSDEYWLTSIEIIQ